jgi:vacuolar-type H+-ATPase subunit F/Vma7
MKISWIKYEKDNKNFIMPERLGFDVFKLNNPEETDKKIEELIKDKYNTIFITNEIASFSNDIIKKYGKDDKIKIIITKTKE